MTKRLNKQVDEFRDWSLAKSGYPDSWLDTLYKKVRVNGRNVNMTVLVVCGVAENGHIVIIAVEPMAGESENSSRTLFDNLNGQGIVTSKLVISGAHVCLTAAIRKSFPWTFCPL